MNILQNLRRFFGIGPAQAARPKPRHRVIPRLESLEDRVVPYNQNTWVGPSGGLWSVASNWSLGHIPTSSDNLIFTDSIHRGANTDSKDDISSVTVGNFSVYSFYTAKITILAGNSLRSSVDITQNGSLAMNPGSSITAAINVSLNGTVTTVSSGTTGNVTITAGGLLSIGGSIKASGSAPSGEPALKMTGGISQGGILTADTPAPVELDGTYTLMNAGKVILQSLTSLKFSMNGIANPDIHGTIAMQGATITTNNALKLDGGAINTSSNMDKISGALLNGGTIVWSGIGNYHQFEITGNYSSTIPGAGTLAMRVASTTGDNLKVDGTASLQGTLNVSAGTSLMVPTTWTLITAVGGLSGDFATINYPLGYTWSHSKTSTTFTITD